MMHCVLQSGTRENSECSHQKEMINVEDDMYANYPNLIFTHLYTNRNITSYLIFHSNQKKKRERHQIYSTLERKRKSH